MAKIASIQNHATLPIARMRPLVVLGVLILCFVLLRSRLEGVDLGSVASHVQGISSVQWIAALFLTAGSFAAIGIYDDYIHRWLNTGISSYRAAVSGAASIAVSQMVGFGLVTGTFARWRMVPDLPFIKVAQVTAAVTASFMVSLLVVVTGALLIGPVPDHAPSWLLPVGLAAATLAVAASLIRSHRFPIALPPLRMMGGILTATLVDTVLAGLAFYVLLPPELGLEAQVLIPAFLIALGAGLLCGSPAGAGGFELTLLLLLPFVPEPELLATIVAFRIVYYVIPALVGMAVLLLRNTPAAQRHDTPEDAGPMEPPKQSRAEAGLARLGEFEVASFGSSHVLAADSGQALVVLGNPLTGPRDPVLRGLEAQAKARGLIPAVYKCGARFAVEARAQGWSCLKCAEDLWIDPTAFSPNTPRRRQLRRKLKAAQSAGILIEPVTGPLPEHAMAEVAKSWAKMRGGERGFSMGRWHPDYVAGQRCYVARKNGRIVAFATFHEGAQDWALDLMRATHGAPDGTMHSLIAAAIDDAGKAGCKKLSLAALPPADQPRWVQTISGRLRLSDGLRQFKTSFAPDTEPLYLVSKGPFGLGLAALDILRRVMWPAPITPKPRPVPAAPREHAWNSISS